MGRPLQWLALALALAGVPASADARPLNTGFFDEVFVDEPPATWFERADDAGASMVRIAVSWRAVAPSHPAAGFAPEDPADPQYGWDRVDRAVDAAEAQGLRVLLTISHAPDWAEGANRPASVPGGAWRPDTQAFAQFARAAALRYGERAAAWQIWNEPNLTTYLAPQWTGEGADRRAVGVTQYRSLLNVGGDAIRAVVPGATIVTGGTGPFGEPPGGQRTAPALFVRQLLCLSGSLKATSCPEPARFDALAHHPYSVGGPEREAINPEDVSVPDLSRLTRLLRAAERLETVRPDTRKRLWVTEFSWDSSPPDPDGVPDARRAQWISRALHSFWRQGVDTVLWYLIRDQTGEFPVSYQSGFYLSDGTPKPASLRAFRFPFTATRDKAGRVRYWGLAPAGETVLLQRRDGSRWRTLRRIETTLHQPFSGSLRSGGPVRLRAVADGRTAVSVRVGQ